MAIETLYRCDHCGWIQTTAHRADEKDREFWKVSLNVEGLSDRYHSRITEQSALWCNECFKESGIHPPLLKVEGASKLPTFEDLVRQIIEDHEANKE